MSDLSNLAAFKVNARTLLHLGAELISSDAVAFYELIKNSFDAQSERVQIKVVSRLNHEVSEVVRELIGEQRKHLPASPEASEEYAELVRNFRDELRSEIDPSEKDLLGKLDAAETLEALEHLMDEANYIDISDTGEGMSLSDLKDIYLTIGTSNRERQRLKQSATASSSADARPLLGEKGIGRLSAMRLGWLLHVKTTQYGDEHWNILRVDWREFDDYDKLIEEVEVERRQGPKKDDPEVMGTRLRISALASSWSAQKLEQTVRKELARFVDPFSKDRWFPISVKFNGARVTVPRMQELLFKHAHMRLEGNYKTIDDEPRFEGRLRVRERDNTKNVEGDTKIVCTTDQLISLTKQSQERLVRVGPFSLILYWFNRRILTKIDGIGTAKEVRDLQAQWSGIMLFRDGFRIHPYGNEDDDWLDFDRTAFSRTSYKLNRAQFIGKIDIGRGQNPYLIDQANREGLKDTPEKEVLISFVRNLVQDEVWAIMAGWEKAQKKADPASVLKNKQKRMKKQVADIKKLLDQLASNDGGPPDPDHAERAAAAQSVREFLDNTVESTISEASRFVAEAQDERAVVMHLAGIGLMLEVVAHELKRATTAALASVTKLLRRTSQDDGIRQPLRTLQAQLKNLEKRVRILDPHSTAGRNRKEQFDIIDWTRAVLDTHQAQVEAMGGSYSCEVASGSTDRWTVEMVKGIYLQIVENLINNSVHWLAIRKSRDAGFVPRITVIFDSTKKTVAVSDNGPGIPFEQGERVFEPFVTKRPPGESRGLGLYIARENAKYVGLRIALSETPVIHEGYYNTFIISWGDEA